MAAEDTARDLREATSGFDALFSNDIDNAREIFKATNSPFHLLGAGVCAFLEAALGMESGLMAEATKLLGDADAGASKGLSAAKRAPSATRFPAGTEWELIISDAVILHALTLALSESYMGYLQCFYELNKAHSKFARLYKTVFPGGLDNYATPATSKTTSPAPSVRSDSSSTHTATPTKQRSGFFGRFGASNLTVQRAVNPVSSTPDGPVEELIMSGTAFGYGLFNLVFSLLPATVRGVVGFLGFKHDRKLALRALAVSANQTDVHAVFAGLVLMTYYGVVLLLTGYQADGQHILKQYRAMIDHVEARYPTGSLWILNRAKLMRMSYDTPGAIKVLQGGLEGPRPQSFRQADGLIIFELAWCLLSQRRYDEAAEMFVKITEINSWSHATYYFIAAGCYLSLQNYEKAQKLLDAVPDLLEKKKIGGKDLPTEVWIKKKLAFYKQKQERLTGSEADWIKCIKISPAEELGIFWNTHARITADVCEEHVKDLCVLTPYPTIQSPLVPTKFATPASDSPDLDTADELAVRSLLLGIVHRTAGHYPASREFLLDSLSMQKQIKVSTWLPGVASFEMAVLDLKEAEATLGAGGSGSEKVLLDEQDRQAWLKVLKKASEQLDQALSLSPQSIDMSSRLDSRITMLRDEIATKREMVEKA
ncbi:mitochondrial outer membrane protein [Phanerochaete sordida]|uniref:Mitochondrial outer membrane protein n=1 Tax=Phanerochaete sordida TaxID=48140 RepID=A0A9P3LA00_9APHY|nr:mitochondrial outer membrane protein [Phanerochaete sordida]